MSANSSLSFLSNLSLHLPPSSSPSNSSLPFECFLGGQGSYVLVALSCCYIFLFLPLCFFILHLGRRRKQRPAATMSNTDFITYNIIVMEIVAVLACCLFSIAVFAEAPMMVAVGFYIFAVITPAQILCHNLTCVERYLAVIHPVFYLRLRQTDGVRIRNITIGCVWVLSLGWLAAMRNSHLYAITFVLLLVLSIILTSFCSLSILHFLLRPGPGEGGGGRERQKRRAFQTVVVITGALLLRFGAEMLTMLIHVSAGMSDRSKCLTLLSGLWLTLPSSYVLPMLFLHRAGKLACSKRSADSGPSE